MQPETAADDAATLTIERPPQTARAALRDAVLAGQFFTARYAGTAAELAGFIAAPAETAPGLLAWFGPETLGRLGPVRDRILDALDRDIAALDALIAEQLDAILHRERVQHLEGSWRGLHWLVFQADAGSRVKIRLLPASWAEICRDLERALEFDQSCLFARIYEDEFGMAGGEPFGLLVVDHAVRPRRAPGAPTDDIEALRRLAGVAAAAFAPTVLAAHPALLGVDSFDELAGVQDLTSVFSTPDYARWRRLSQHPDTRFLALALPRVLGRPAWDDQPTRNIGFRYREYAPSSADRVWTSAAYAFAACAIRAFAEHQWPADVRGVETDRVGGGLVQHIPAEPFSVGPARVWPRVGIECVFTDTQERALVDAGLMPLAALPYSDAELAFGAARSLQRAAVHIGPSAAIADTNARLSAQINSMLCASRFAHYLKIMARDMTGSFQTADQIERRLNSWLQQYVNTNIKSTGESRARFPLVAGEVAVREKAGKPGAFDCKIWLQPHFQLDDVASTFSLVTEIVSPQARGKA